MSLAKDALALDQVHQGDCVDLLKKTTENTIDLVFADPPFNIGYQYDVYDDSKQTQDYLDWCRQWISEVHRVLKPNGSFWLAIGDEHAAELKIEAQQAGFHCRSWVIWYYTFGVNCVNGFSRSHTHLFHFVSDPDDFTFNRTNPQIRVKSARQLVYADARANPNGRLPDNTWIIRPQDAPLSFSPGHDTWYFARVAGTFKEREGFHGCQMPEQLLARVIRASSHPRDLVLDPFGGSGTTLCVAKKLGRRFLGFELSSEYVKYIRSRLESTQTGDPIDGPEDPIQSAPSTAKGKKRKKPFDDETEKAVIHAYEQAGEGYPADYLLCDADRNKAFLTACREQGLGGSAMVWNRYLLALRKTGKLPRSTRSPQRLTATELNQYAYASEVAWRLLEIDYQQSLDDLLCSPDFAKEFDRLADRYGPRDTSVSSLQYRRAALAIRKRMKTARTVGRDKFDSWMRKPLSKLSMDNRHDSSLDAPGLLILSQQDAAIFAYETVNLRDQLERMWNNPHWQELAPDTIHYATIDGSLEEKTAIRTVLVRRTSPLLNSPHWVTDSVPELLEA